MSVPIFKPYFEMSLLVKKTSAPVLGMSALTEVAYTRLVFNWTDLEFFYENCQKRCLTFATLWEKDTERTVKFFTALLRTLNHSDLRLLTMEIIR